MNSHYIAFFMFRSTPLSWCKFLYKIQCIRQSEWGQREWRKRKKAKTIINLIKSSNIKTVQWINCWNRFSCANGICTIRLKVQETNHKLLLLTERFVIALSLSAFVLFFFFYFTCFRNFYFWFSSIFSPAIKFNGPSKFHRFHHYATICMQCTLV